MSGREEEEEVIAMGREDALPRQQSQPGSQGHQRGPWKQHAIMEMRIQRQISGGELRTLGKNGCYELLIMIHVFLLSEFYLCFKKYDDNVYILQCTLKI